MFVFYSIPPEPRGLGADEFDANFAEPTNSGLYLHVVEGCQIRTRDCEFLKYQNIAQ